MAAVPGYEWPKIIDEVVDWLATGKTIRAYCRQDGKPSKDAVYDYINAQGEEVERRIVRARARGADDIAEEGLEILDECAEKPELANACKARFDGRMRLLAKWNSGRYGDKSQVEHSGKVELPAMDDREAATRLAALLREAQRQQGK